jgi:hypothetical protein
LFRHIGLARQNSVMDGADAPIDGIRERMVWARNGLPPAAEARLEGGTKA